MILDLDPGFHPIQGTSIAFQSFVFSGGEPHTKITEDFSPGKDIVVTHRINSFNDMGLLLVAIDALKRFRPSTISVFIPYFPAARQDRIMVPGEALTVKVYADLLNALNLHKVTVLDPHSEVTPALLNECEVLTNYGFVAQVLKQLPEDTLLISPDGGALKKVYGLAAHLGGLPVIECSKTRNTKTGALSGFKVYAEHLEGKNCLVVDDICDGGGTFIGLAEQLKAKGAKNLYLAVTHGIFSKGVQALSDSYQHVFCTDSVRHISEEKLTQIPIHSFIKTQKI